jgi:diguanylate cyclase (GGDEF)-like protein
LQHDANTDDLTQVPNRKQLAVIGQQEFERARRFGHGLSVWMLDVDHFKSINDTYGHEAGDLALQSLVHAARRALRDWDVLGRWGGEEFAVLLPETENRESLLAAERLRQAVAATPMLTGAGQEVHMTVSIGIASAQDDDDALQSLINRADKALYVAKKTGRNKVCVAPFPAAPPSTKS